ncbi:MAG: hypothetical protein HYR80_09080 [Nitrospirae bacterium]|nr:hypothetical protein [Nitrospirota bacterium]
MNKNGYKIIIGYLIIVGTLFLGSYLLYGIRESRLYLLLMVINLPDSLVIVPGMEEVAMVLGWVIGGPPHVWATQIACMVVNGILLFSMIKIVQKLRR